MTGVRSDGRIPALDGIRGLAIALVIAGHSIDGYAVAGPAGVAVFFALSGYLITSILLREHDDIGRIDVRAFYLRRARRLLPAFAVYLAAALALGVVLHPDFGSLSAGWPALLYIANLNRIWGFGDLGGMLDPVRGMGHLWSLSIEEQFYLLFPALLIWLLRRRPKRLLVAIITLAAASLALRLGLHAVMGEAPRIYFGTDTTACLLLAGCALAIWRRGGGSLPNWVAAPALLAILPLGFWVHDSKTTLVPVIAAALTVAAIAGSQEPQRWLAFYPLRLLGQRSYALYLWHAPALLVWRLADWGLLGWLVCVGTAWGVTLASWRWVERPWLSGGLGQRARGERHRLADLQRRV